MSTTLPLIRNRVKCGTCDRDVPFAGDATHRIALQPGPDDLLTLDVTCTARSKAPWYVRVWQWVW